MTNGGISTGYAKDLTTGFYGGKVYGGSAPCSGSGEITATFTWNTTTGEPVPATLIVKEECNTSAGALASGNSPSVNADADNNLGHAKTVTNSSSGNSVSKNVSCNGIRYRVVEFDPNNPGKIVVKCSPSASASASIGSPGPGSQMSTNVNVWYKVSIGTVEMLRDGQRITGQNKKALPGQRINLTISGADANTTYSWDHLSQIFNKFDAGKTPPNNDQLELVPEPEYSDSEFNFCWIAGNNDKRSINCKVLVAGQQVIVQGVIQVFKPTVTWTSQQRAVSFDDPYDPTTFGLQPINIRGIQWTAKVTIPSGYGSAVGNCSFLQLITPQQEIWVGTQKKCHIGNGQEGLDGVFPYIGQTWQTGVNSDIGDSPRIDLTTGSDNRVTRVLYGNNSFKTYLMFVPPGTASQYVPLAYTNWSFSGEAVYGPNPNNGGQEEYYQVSGTGVATPVSVAISTHPVWNRQNVTQFVNCP